jgi:hypothetical protein
VAALRQDRNEIFFGVLFPKTRQTRLVASMVYGEFELEKKKIVIVQEEKI